MFFDLKQFQKTTSLLKKTFPNNFVHAAAVKANPTLAIMRKAYEEGMGFESASLGELTQSIRACPEPLKIVFDSPVKTISELEYALSNGVNINIDNFQELDLLCSLVQENTKYREYYKSQGRIGLRINPQIGSGSIGTHSTGQNTSKFGVGLEDLGARELIFSYFKKFDFLKMLHVHSGSQGMELEALGRGIRKVVDLAKAIGPQVDTLDIGGGLAVNFSSDEVTPTFCDYSTILRQQVPELFDNTFRLVLTEFGRSVFAKLGWFASTVEYTKNNGGRQIVLQHVGADIAIRTIYHPTVWPLRIEVYKKDGTPSHNTEVIQDIAGPCCIAGDIVAHQRLLPLVEPGDYVVVKDVGAYYHSSYSRYNCRQAPPIIGYKVDGENVEFEILQKGETVEESLEMFSRL